MTREEMATELFHIKAWINHWKSDKEFGLLPTDISLDMVSVRLEALAKELKEKVNG